MRKSKRQNIVQTASELFFKHGIRRIAVQEICEKAGASKMTFYKYFKNKTDLVMIIMQQMLDDSMEEYHEIMKRDLPYPEKVILMIQLKMKATEKFSAEFYNDLMTMKDPDIMTLFGRARQEGLTIVLQDFLKAQENGDIRAGIKPEFINYIMDHLIEMAEDPRVKQIFDSPQAIISELTNFFFYGILAR